MEPMPLKRAPHRSCTEMVINDIRGYLSSFIVRSTEKPENENTKTDVDLNLLLSLFLIFYVFETGFPAAH